MTIIKVEKQIYTKDGNVNIVSECLTDDLRPVTSGKIACILNANLLVDIQEVTTGKNTFTFNISGHLQKNKEHLLRLEYSGSIQAEKKSVSSVILYDKKYDQSIDAQVVAQDYFTKRNETFNFTSKINVPDEVIIEGKAVLKLNNKTIAQTQIVDNKAQIEFKVPNMILDEHVMLWMYMTNHGIFATSSMLHLLPRIPVVSKEYYEDKGVTRQIRDVLKEDDIDKKAVSDDDTLVSRVKKIFGG